MEFIFERNKLKNDSFHRIKSATEICDCLKELGMVYAGYLGAENRADYECGLFLKRTEVYSDWGDKWETDYYYKIDFCPVCGEKIIIKIIEGRDYTEKYKILEEERETLHKEEINCDSKKRSAELSTKIWELHEQMNSFYDEEILLSDLID